MLTRLVRRVTAREDRGSAIVNVLVLMIVTSIVAVGIGTSVIVSGDVTMTTTQDVRADAAADAGIDYARAQIVSGDPGCDTDGWDQRNQTPSFVVGEPRYFAADGITELACTTPLLSTVAYARVVSTGYSSATSSASTQVGAEFEVTPATPAASEGTGPAAYVYGGGSINAFTISVPAGVTEPGDLNIPTGNLNCSTVSTIQGSVIVSTGTATLSNACRINGNLEAKGDINLKNTSRVGGHVHSSTGKVKIDGSSVVVGSDVKAGGSIDGIAGGSVGGSVLGVGSQSWSFNPTNATVAGNITIGGTLTTWGYAWNVPSASAPDYEKAAYHLTTTTHRVGGTIAQNQTGLASQAPVLPTVPQWGDWSNYSNAEWAEHGFTTVLTWPSNACSVSSGPPISDPSNAVYQLMQQIRSATTPTVVNALGCSSVNFSLSAQLNLALKTDVVFVGRAFTLEGMTLNSADSTDRNVYFLIPDSLTAVAPATPVPNCGYSGCAFATNNAVTVGSHLAAIVYTPGQVSLSNQTQWRGQLYANSLTVSSGDGLVFVPVGIPGMDLDSGSAVDPNAGNDISVAIASRYPIG